MSERIGYARMSSYGQSLDVQLKKLRAAGCVRIFEEKASASNPTARLALQRMLDYLHEGDTLTITRLDRLGRSVFDLMQIVRQLHDKGVELNVIDQAISTDTPAGPITLHVMAAMADFERALMLERAQEGRLKARARGTKFGPKPRLDDEALAALRAEFANPACNRTQLAAHYGISRSSLYRLTRDGGGSIRK